MTVGPGIKEGQFLWMLKVGVPTGTKLVCPHCRGVGTTDDVTRPCLQCVGQGHITRFLSFVTLLGSVKVESFTYGPMDGSLHLSVLRPPLYLLSAYDGDLVKLCSDYWEDNENGRVCAGAYRVGIKDSDMLYPTLFEALAGARKMNSKLIEEACDDEKTETKEDTDEILNQVTGQTASDSVAVFAHAEIEEALR
jgi:hypothetical protein